MQLVISQNRVKEIKEEEVTKDLIESSVIYTGVDLEWEDLSIYDTEGGKIAPYVRYLLEGESKGSNKKIYIILLITWLIFFIALIFLFLNEKKVDPIIATVPWVSNIIENKQPIRASREIIRSELLEELAEEKKKEKRKDNIIENNVIENNKYLDLWTERKIFELESKIFILNSNIDKLENEKKELELINKELLSWASVFEENITLLKAKIESQKLTILEKKERIRKEPKDEFIYFLWEYLYIQCEKMDPIKDNSCKNLYYNFLK